MSLGDKSDVCDGHLQMFYGQNPSSTFRLAPNCPHCATDRYQRSIQQRIDLMRAERAAPRILEMVDGTIVVAY